MKNSIDNYIPFGEEWEKYINSLPIAAIEDILGETKLPTEKKADFVARIAKSKRTQLEN